MQFFFGTAGWSYKDWSGTVYPDKIPSGFNHLGYIGDRFDFVEVNTTFYRIPDQKLVSGWLRKTDHLKNFKFWIKLNQIFTHSREYNISDIESFRSSIHPLEENNKLCGILIQFPYSFKFSEKSFGYLISLTDKFSGMVNAVEFRHRSWLNSEVRDVFEKKHLVWVNLDQPVISDSIPLTSIVTNSDLSYFRLHGRNYSSWFGNKGRDERYDYSYPQSELFEISGMIKKVSADTGHIFISGNNHYKGSAVKNLILLKQILSEKKESG